MAAHKIPPVPPGRVGYLAPFLLAAVIHGLILMSVENPLPSIKPGKPRTLEVSWRLVPGPVPARTIIAQPDQPTVQSAPAQPPVSKPVHRVPSTAMPPVPHPREKTAPIPANVIQAPPVKRLTADLLGQQISQVSYEISHRVPHDGETLRKTAIENLKAPKYQTTAYEQAWQDKVERIGNLNYPEIARRKRLSGTLKLSVSLKADGSLLNIRIQQSSGQAELDEAAAHIVRLAAPYARFPQDIRAETDVLVITRTWRFLDDFRLQTHP